jgi:hypothetical protein
VTEPGTLSQRHHRREREYLRNLCSQDHGKSQQSQEQQDHLKVLLPSLKAIALKQVSQQALTWKPWPSKQLHKQIMNT